MVGMVVMIMASLITAVVAVLNPGMRAKLRSSRDHADDWIEDAIATWVDEGRISEAEGIRARNELAEPQFHAVLPHFGVHLTISVLLRFPLGSMTRAGYTLANLALATLRFLTHQISRQEWRRLLGTHSPLVILLGAIPGFGALAYLGSRPLRSHPLLLRIGLDAALRKLPWGLYRHSGLESVVARPSSAPIARASNIRIGLRSASIMRLLAIAGMALVVVDLITETVDQLLGSPGGVGWVLATRVFDLNREQSLGTWFTIVLLLAISVMLGVIALHARSIGSRFARHWAGLALIALGMSLDEQVQLHDPGGGMGRWAREALGIGGVLYHGWVIFAAIALVVLMLVYRQFITALPANFRLGALAAAAVFVFGEMGVEMAGAWLIDLNGGSFLTELLTTVEEGLSLAGLLLGVHVLIAYLREYVGQVRLEFESTAPARAPLREIARVPAGKPVTPVAAPISRKEVADAGIHAI
jgi:hypothetical protein